jgi:hypothetical protein
MILIPSLRPQLWTTKDDFVVFIHSIIHSAVLKFKAHFGNLKSSFRETTYSTVGKYTYMVNFVVIMSLTLSLSL